MKFKTGDRVVIIGSKSWSHDGYRGLKGQVDCAWLVDARGILRGGRRAFFVSFIFEGRFAQAVFTEEELEFDALEQLAIL
jgi:hypothetical protein